MVAITKFLLFASAAVATVLPRDPAQVLTDLQNVDSLVKTLNSKATAYNGGVSAALQVQTAANNVDKAINTTTADAKASGQATSAQATSIINYANSPLEPDVKAAVNAVIAKKAKYAADGLTAVVKNTFTQIKKDTDALGVALLAKTPTAQQSAAKSAIAKIDADLQAGINAFS